MRLQITRQFERDYARLPPEMQGRVRATIQKFETDPRHPSLHTKKMKGVQNRWEIRVSDSYRITFQIDGHVVVLRHVGTHDILKRESL